MYNLFDCTFKCLRDALCLSINMAAFKDEGGKIWCELLSSDKYREAKNYKENMTSHHLSIRVRTLGKAAAADGLRDKRHLSACRADVVLASECSLGENYGRHL